jgi:formylglycine-generating enzyme required for sulfatase activity
MFTLRCSLGIGLPLLLGVAVLQEEPKKEPTDETERLIAQLNHSRYVRREEAARKLIEMGEPILEQLRAYRKENPELDLYVRVRQVTRGIYQKNLMSKTTGMRFAVIDAGTFVMGSAINEGSRRGDEDEHTVNITEPYLIGIHEVTQAEYEKVMEKRPSWFSIWGQGKNKIPNRDTSRFPVENVSWFDAIEFCNKLSTLDGYRPYYKIEGAKSKDDSIFEATVTIEGGNGYHLPTEAQWERAARAGTRTPFHFGTRNRGTSANTRPGPITGYGGGPDFNALERTTYVASYPANVWGLHDMCGNVTEWCWDWYDNDYYTKAPENNPRGPAEGKQKSTRGGSWILPEGSCRSASRHAFSPGTYNWTTGFRVIRQP